MLSETLYVLFCASGGMKDVQSIISDYFGDQDPRVRTAAIKAVVGHSEDTFCDDSLYVAQLVHCSAVCFSAAAA